MTTATVSSTASDFFALLDAFGDDQLDKPTSADRAALMKVRQDIKDAQEGEMTEQEAADLAYLNVRSAQMANRQETYYEKNDNTFSDGKKF